MPQSGRPANCSARNYKANELMDNLFDPGHEKAENHAGWSLGLSVVGISLWVVCYTFGIMIVYGVVCPIVIACGIWHAYAELRDKRSTRGWLLLAFSLACLAVSLLPWFLPIATLRNW